jgi:hypothetical protein
VPLTSAVETWTRLHVADECPTSARCGKCQLSDFCILHAGGPDDDPSMSMVGKVIVQ